MTKRSVASYFKGHNFMTPDIVRRGRVGPYVYELSTGRGFGNEPIWGVTVHDTRTDTRADDLSACCFSAQEAEDKIAALKP